MGNKRKLTNVQLKNEPEKLTEVKIQPSLPIIGITYLDPNSYNFDYLFRISRGNRQAIQDFQKFLDKAREYSSIDEMVKCHKPHDKLINEDNKSKNMVLFLREQYNLDVEHLIHLHCLRNGNGQFVIHGFRIRNAFEIVWLDPEHEIHS